MVTDLATGKIAVIIFMLICAVSDFRTRSVSMVVFLGAFVLEVITYIGFAVLGCEINWISIMTGMMPGCFLAIMSLFTKGGLGLGDAIFFIITGIAVGGIYNVLLLAGGVMLSAVYGLVLIILKWTRGESAKKMKFAFLPFVLPAGICIMVTI